MSQNLGSIGAQLYEAKNFHGTARAPWLLRSVYTWYEVSYHRYLGFYQEKNEVYHTIFAKSSCLTMVPQVKILDPTMRSSTQTCYEMPRTHALTPNNPPMTVITL